MGSRRGGNRPEGAEVAGRETGELTVGREWRDLPDTPVGVGPQRRIARRRPVDAADRIERILTVVVMAVIISALVVIGEHQQRVGLGAALQGQESSGQVLPVLRGVERVEGSGEGIGIAQSAGI